MPQRRTAGRLGARVTWCYLRIRTPALQQEVAGHCPPACHGSPDHSTKHIFIALGSCSPICFRGVYRPLEVSVALGLMTAMCLRRQRHQRMARPISTGSIRRRSSGCGAEPVGRNIVLIEWAALGVVTAHLHSRLMFVVRASSPAGVVTTRPATSNQGQRIST
jgi:hypothetical protein